MEAQVIAMYHPAAALHQPRLWSVMLDDWEHFPVKADAGYIVVSERDIIASAPGVMSLDTENSPLGGLGHWSYGYRDHTSGELRVALFYGRPKLFHCTPKVAFHNARWDLRVLAKAGIKIPASVQVVDTMIAAYCLGLGRQNIKTEESNTDTGMIGGLGLKYLARRHLGMEMRTWEDVKDKPDEQAEYNVKDTIATLLLWERWEKNLPQHFWTIDMPLLPVLMAIEDRGIAVDPTRLREVDRHFQDALKGIELPFNPLSTQQLQTYVYGQLGIEPFKFTDTGQPSVALEVLETIDDPVIRKVLEYKSLHKDQGTYTSNYLERLDANGRVHSEYKQCSTATGRLSAANPNPQNVPRGEMRALFVAAPGHSLVRADWEQIELRAVAVLANDEAMLEMFAKGKNIHQETANLLNIDYQTAKTINFMMLYGGSDFAMSAEFHIPIDDARTCIARYFGKYKGVKAYYEGVIATATETKRVKNWFGRERRMDALYAEDRRVIRQGLREAINTPIQGTAAEIVKLAMIDLHHKHAAPMVLQAHDEILFEVPMAQANEYAHWLAEHIPTLVEIKGHRFPVTTSVGQNWKEAIDAAKETNR